MKIKVGLVDDHQLFLKSLGLMLETLNDFIVVLEALNGSELQPKMKTISELPDIMLIDVNMPFMDGVETSNWLQEHYPSIKLIALSMNDSETAIIKMFKAGCCSYLLKDLHPANLAKALHEVYQKGYYNGDSASFNMARLFKNTQNQLKLAVNEMLFLQLACSDLTYKQIASQMKLSERTIDGYREALFQKFQVKSRVGLCLEALRKELVRL